MIVVRRLNRCEPGRRAPHGALGLRGLLGYESRMLRKFIAIAAWSCLAFIVYATLSPLAGRPALTDDEPEIVVILERFCGYAVLGCLMRLTFARRMLAVCILVLGTAALLELLQVFVPDRDARIVDALEKLAGGVAGISFADAVLTFGGFRDRKDSIVSQVAKLTDE